MTNLCNLAESDSPLISATCHISTAYTIFKIIIVNCQSQHTLTWHFYLPNIHVSQVFITPYISSILRWSGPKNFIFYVASTVPPLPPIIFHYFTTLLTTKQNKPNQKHDPDHYALLFLWILITFLVMKMMCLQPSLT